MGGESLCEEKLKDNHCHVEFLDVRECVGIISSKVHTYSGGFCNGLKDVPHSLQPRRLRCW